LEVLNLLIGIRSIVMVPEHKPTKKGPSSMLVNVFGSFHRCFLMSWLLPHISTTKEWWFTKLSKFL
jgi:hypothetical protein